MTFIEHGTQGAFRQTWRKGNPRALLETIVQKNPKADDEKIYRLFWEEIQDDKEILQDIAGYWLDLTLRSLRRSDEPPANGKSASPSPSSKTERPAPAAAATKLRERVVHETHVVLLNMIAPNGNRLGDCTGATCKTFGGFYAYIAKHVPANKTVQAVLDEDALQKLWRLAKSKK